MNRLLICTAIVLFIVTGCNKPPAPDKNDDNKDQQEQPSPYAGEWEYTEIELSNGVVLLANNQVGTFTGTGKDMVGFVKMTEDPNEYTTELEFTAVLSINVFQQTLNQEMPNPKSTSSGEWDDENGKLTLTPDDLSEIEVISATESKIVFKGNFSQEVTYGQFTMDANSDVLFTVEKKE